MATISIIIPVYNVEKYLSSCVESLLSQTISENLEIILVNDGSTDNSGNICDEYAKKDKRIKVFHQQNQGVCAARNKGMEMASGEFLTFVDADDYMPHDAIEALYKDITENNADMAIGKMASDIDKNTYSNILTVWKDEECLINGLQDHPALYGCCNKLYKMELVKDIRFEVGRKVHEDGYFVFLTLIKLPVVTVRDKHTYTYRYNPQSASRAPFSEKYFDVLYFEDKKRQIIKERFPHLMEKAYNKLVKAHITMLHIFCKTKDKKYNKDIKESISIVRKYSKYYIEAIPGEKKFFLIVKYGGYWLYRRLYWIKYRKAM